MARASQISSSDVHSPCISTTQHIAYHTRTIWVLQRPKVLARQEAPFVNTLLVLLLQQHVPQHQPLRRIPDMLDQRYTHHRRRASRRLKVIHQFFRCHSDTKQFKAIDLDARDPQFASRLSSIGAVQPNPHFSHSSTSSFDPQRNTSTTQPSDAYGMMNELPQSAFPDPGNNPALRILDARQRIQQEAEEELENVGRQSFRGRKYVDASTITLALMRRQRGEPDGRIEEALGIKKGRLSALREGMITSV